MHFGDNFIIHWLVQVNKKTLTMHPNLHATVYIILNELV